MKIVCGPRVEEWICGEDGHWTKVSSSSEEFWKSEHVRKLLAGAGEKEKD